MGVNNSKIEDFLDQSFSLKDYDIVEKRHEISLGGEIQLLQNKYDPSDIKIMKEYQYLGKNKIEEEISNLENLIKINNSCPYFLKVIGYTHFKDSIFCGKIQKISLIYEYIENSLYTEKIFRFENKKKFTEDEIFKLLQNISTANLYLQKNNLYLNNLQSQIIFLGKEIFKIPMPGLFNLPNYVDYFRASKKENYFLSPEIINHIKNKNLNMSIDFNKSNVFVLGCIVLEIMGKIQNSHDLYKEDMILEKSLIEMSLKFIKNDYSEIIHSIISQMMVENPEKRINFNQILSQIPTLSSHNNVQN